MFNDKYGLTQAVLEGRKTMTRRIAKGKPRYQVGELVAIAECYKNVYGKLPICEGRPARPNDYSYDPVKIIGEGALKKGYRNKMFVRVDLMPHHIKITDVMAERLQDISEEDCLREGIFKRYHAPICLDCFYIPNVPAYAKDYVFFTAKEAFASLIDKICGKGTWESNPLVEVYTFELID